MGGRDVPFPPENFARPATGRLRSTVNIRRMHAVQLFRLATSARRPRHQLFALGATTLAVLLSAGVSAASPAAGKQTDTPTIVAAAQALQGGEVAAAVHMLETLSIKDPDDTRVWRTLGRAYQQSHQNRRAIVAYRRALKLEPDSPQVLYNLGSAYAAEGDAAQAFAWLARARATHRYDMTQITVDESLKALQSDPRFGALLPGAGDFEHPFAEPVKILREWRGEAANDQFGWIARNIGDVDWGTVLTTSLTSARRHMARGTAIAGNRDLRCVLHGQRQTAVERGRLAPRKMNWAPASRRPATPITTAFRT